MSFSRRTPTGTSETESYFRDLYELGADPSVPLEEKIARAVVSGHGWDGRVEVDDGTRFVFSGVGNVAKRLQ